jgi:hypothetical protein
VLIEDLATYILSLDTRVTSDASFDPTTVEASLLSFYEFDSATQSHKAVNLSTDPRALQRTYDDIAAGKDLAGKIAGNDAGGRNEKDDSTDFFGWSDDSIARHGGSITSPDGLVRAFFATIEDNAVKAANGDDARTGLPVHLTESGLDLQELTEDFLLGAVAFSQAADVYLDEGIESDNSALEDGEPFTALEHAWDEGFGYFGASRDYLKRTPAELDQNPAYDTDGDGRTDLLSEYTFGPAASAKKRDLGSATGTTLGDEIMKEFIDGRYLIQASGQPVGLRDSADKIILRWEKVLAASAVHYINELMVDMSLVEKKDYDFSSHAKNFSGLKGFALSFQFNPRSPLSEKKFKALHRSIGDSPVLSGDEELARYEEALLEVRATLGVVYDFESADLEQW